MNNLPLISVITPTYNRKELLEKAVLSVLNQERGIPFDFEIIVVDDGSTDGTEAFFRKYVETYPGKIRYFYQKNAGVGRARNLGISNMSPKSDYVILLDSDDELKSDCFKKCLEKFEELKKDWRYEQMLWLGYFCENENGKLIGTKDVFNGAGELEMDYKSVLRRRVPFEIGSILKSAIYLKHPEFRFPEDIVTESVLWMKIWRWQWEKGIKILLMNYVGRIFRQNHTGQEKITRTISIERFRKNAIGNERIIDVIGEDLLRFRYLDSYWEYVFRAGINWLLAWERKKWIRMLWKSLRFQKNLRNFGISVLWTLSSRTVLWIYKIYIEHI